MRQLNHWEEKFWSLCEEAVKGQGLSLYDLNYFPPEQKLCLTIIDEESKTATLEHCISVDRALSEPFEAADWIPEGVMLEVSSPGINRVLRHEEHWRFAIGEQVELTTKSTLLELFANDETILPTSKAKRVRRQHVVTVEEVQELGVKVAFDLDKGLQKSLLIPWQDIKEAFVFFAF